MLGTNDGWKQKPFSVNVAKAVITSKSVKDKSILFGKIKARAWHWNLLWTIQSCATSRLTTYSSCFLSKKLLHSFSRARKFDVLSLLRKGTQIRKGTENWGGCTHPYIQGMWWEGWMKQEQTDDDAGMHTHTHIPPPHTHTLRPRQGKLPEGFEIPSATVSLLFILQLKWGGKSGKQDFSTAAKKSIQLMAIIVLVPMQTRERRILTLPW